MSNHPIRMSLRLSTITTARVWAERLAADLREVEEELAASGVSATTRDLTARAGARLRRVEIALAPAVSEANDARKTLDELGDD